MTLLVDVKKVTVYLIFTLLLLSRCVQSSTPEIIGSKSERALSDLDTYTTQFSALMAQSAGVLVFPDIVKTGFGKGGQYGEGVLLVGGAPLAHYATSGATFGLPLDVGYKSEVIFFMTDQALREFQRSQSWEIGVDSQVFFPTISQHSDVKIDFQAHPIIGFVFSDLGINDKSTMTGSRVSRIAR